MSRPYYDDQGDSIPQYYPDQPHPHPFPRQRPAGHNSSRIPQPQHYAPQDRRRIQPSPMNPGHSSPSPSRPRRQHQEPYHPEQSAWDASQGHFYQGSGYEDQYQYGPYEEQYDQQWPLPVQPQAHTSPNVNSTPRKTPRRPPRPDESPNRLENQRPVRDPPRSTPQTAIAERHRNTPSPAGSYHGNGQWTGDGYAYAAPMYPPPSRPLPPANPGGQSGIPQYVSPQMPQQAVYGHANRRPPLGPPPSARRGPANYYPQVGPVHPIAEETDSMRGSLKSRSVRTDDHNSKTSFASSNAIPIGIPHFYVDEGNARPSTGELSNTTGGGPSSPSDYDDDEQSTEAAARRTLDRSAEDSPRQRGEHSPILVRQASLGKKSRPTLVTQKSGDKLRKGSFDREAGIFPLPTQQHARKASREALPRINTQHDIDTQHGIETLHSRALAQNKLEGQAEPGADDSKLWEQTQASRNAAAVAAATARMYNDDNMDGAGRRTPEQVMKSSTGPREQSLVDESGTELKRKRSRELLGAAIAKEPHPARSTTRSPLAPSDDERVKSILESLEKGGAISAEEANELKQPTAGLSERAGRPRPPRINVDAVHEAEARGSLTSLPDLIRRATKLASNLDRGKTASRLGMEHWLSGAAEGEKRKSGAGSISDMLSAFPPPKATPPGSQNGWRSSHLRHSELPSDSDAGEPKKRGRRCCGMPLLGFILLIFVLFLLVAAAVVVPVVLIYLPNQNKGSNSTAANSVGRCQSVLTCDNGGTNILSSNHRCECLCVNGFTGRTCSTHSEQGCTTTSIGPTNDATVGEAIPRLLKGSSSNFSVPLDGQEVLGLFSANDLGCAAQNALVTFNNKASRRSYIDVVVQRAPAPVTAARQATSNGLLVATGSPSSTSPARPTATSSDAAPTSTATHNDKSTLDFARVAVLFVLQDTANVDQAADAQEALQAYFHGNANSQGQTTKAQNVTLATGYSCNLVDHTIITGNGTTVGGNGKGTTTSSSAV